MQKLKARSHTKTIIILTSTPAGDILFLSSAALNAHALRAEWILIGWNDFIVHQLENNRSETDSDSTFLLYLVIVFGVYGPFKNVFI